MEQNEKIILEKIKKFVEEECKSPESKYGEEIYYCHFIPMVSYARTLANKEPHVDMFIVEAAAWLHDIGSIIFGRKDHHITGANLAGKKLQEFGVEDKKIEMIQECIYSHRGSQKIQRNTKEAQIVADADTLSAFDNISGLFKAAVFHEGLSQIQAKVSVKQKLLNSWNKLSAQAKDIIRVKYEAAMLLLA